MAHPGGLAAGVASLREAWEAAIAGSRRRGYARPHASANCAEALA